MSERKTWKTKRVDLRIATTGIELELLRDDDGKLSPSDQRFLSLERLHKSWATVCGNLRAGKAIRPADAEAMGDLMWMMLHNPGGPKLLTALREYHRRQIQSLLKLMDDEDAVKVAEANADADMDAYGSQARQLRRQKENLRKRRCWSVWTSTLRGGCP